MGTSISSQQTNGDFNFQGVDLWPFMGAFVSPGGAPVTASFYGYDPDANALSLLGSAQTTGEAGDQFLSWSWSGGGPWLIDVTFSSTATFAIDDLTLGLQDHAPGIPEPTVWAMMLLGFTGAGLGLRARRRAGAQDVVG